MRAGGLAPVHERPTTELRRGATACGERALRFSLYPSTALFKGDLGLAMVTIEELRIADEPARWEALGFTVEGDSVWVGSVRVRLAGESSGRGMTGWTLRGALSSELDGLPTRLSEGVVPDAGGAQPNGVVGIDHVVAFTPALDRTIGALQAGGLDLRRVREEPTPAGAPRQAFFRLGEAILEVVQMPAESVERAGGADRPARLWGLALRAEDLEATAAYLGEACGEIRAAVQPGRRIATVRRRAGLAVALALMSPEPVHAG